MAQARKVRNMDTKVDLKKVTRARAEKMVAATNDPETLRWLGDHTNKHVRAKAAYKVEKLAKVEGAS
jgi:hypothetical protein